MAVNLKKSGVFSLTSELEFGAFRLSYPGYVALAERSGKGNDGSGMADLQSDFRERGDRGTMGPEDPGLCKSGGGYLGRGGLFHSLFRLWSLTKGSRFWSMSGSWSLGRCILAEQPAQARDTSPSCPS